jgi:hypothetical protein
MTEKLENILEKCLERITVKGESIETCLRDYPEHASQLEPLLRTAISASSRTHDIKPTSELKLKATNQMLSEIQHRQQKKGKEVRTLAWKYRWALPAMLLLLLLISSGVVIGANDSMPGEPLYPVKTTMEKVQLTLTPSDLGKAKLHVKFAERRTKEMIAMDKKKKAREVEKLAGRVKQELNKTAILANSIKTSKDGKSKVEKVRSKILKSAILTSSDGLPHESLYQVQIAVEDTLLKLTPSELSQAELRIEFAEQRVQKMTEISNNNNSNFQELDELLLGVDQHLGNLDTLIESLVSQGGGERDLEEIRALLESNAARNIEIYNEALKKAATQASPALEKALERSQLRFNAELASLDKITQDKYEKSNGKTQ